MFDSIEIEGMQMFILRKLSRHHKLVAVAALAAAGILVGPVSSAEAVAPNPNVTVQGHIVAATKTKVVPNVVGKTADAAKDMLKRGGLSYSYSAPKGSVVLLSKNWTVTKQSPKAKSKVKAGTKVKLTVVKTSTLTAAPSAAPTTAAAAPAGPTLSPAQLQAVFAAKNYLSDGQGFSYQGLIDQLTSSYGNGFSVPDATAAVNSLNPDWNAQAVIAAKNYVSDGQGFSHDSLIEQLTSPYGNKFTADQAAYAVAQVGL